MKVVVSGAGIAGLSLAVALRRSGIECVLVEKSLSLPHDGYMIDFWGTGYDAAAALEVLDDLAKIHFEIPELIFVDGHGHEKYRLRYRDIRKRIFNGRHFNFMRGALARTLEQHARDAARLCYGTEIAAVEQHDDGVDLTLTNGERLAADCLVAADGVHSGVRRLVFDEAGAESFLGFAAAAFIVDEPIGNGGFITLTEVRRQVSVYPIGGGRTATFFIHPRAQRLGHRSPDVALDELHRVYGDLPWLVPRLLSTAANRDTMYFDDVVQIKLPRWSHGRVVLLGDAAYCVSLLAGQGASLAMAGACILAQELQRSRELPEAFRTYERRLRGHAERAQKSARRIARWFVPDNRTRLLVRDLTTRWSANAVVAPLFRRALPSGPALNVF